MLKLIKSLLKQIPPMRNLIRERDQLRAKLDLIASQFGSELSTRTPCYQYDGMYLFGKNMDWMTDPKFTKAYFLGMNSGHKICRTPGSHEDIHIEWRIHIICWAAMHATKLSGDFVECGVNTGICSLAACQFVDFNKTGKNFYLFDTFNGIPESQMSTTERDDRVQENRAYYEDCYETTKRNFANYPNVHLVKGMVPDTLTIPKINQVAYLSIDMNIAAPEVAAMEYFWDKLVPGALVILDDYGWQHYHEQTKALDAFAERKGMMIATLPTGQGLIVKPS